MSDKRKCKKIIYGEKREACNRGKRTQMPGTVTEGLPALFAGELCYWCLTGF